MAGIIKKEDIEQVRNAADLYDVVSQTVTLKSSGSGTYMGLCPFHDEKTPSFSVRPSLGMWHCFGCGAGGDIFSYVEKRDSVGFAEAVEELADMYSIELHYEAQPGRTVRQEGSKRSRLLQANEEAQKFFEANLGTAEAMPARQLLGGRNFTAAQAQRFGCGYAPRGGHALVDHLSSKGFTRKEMVDAGLARLGQRDIHDWFQGRATWPIRDSAGRTLGFGARRLYDDDRLEAKYINTPDTQLYEKKKVLYGLDLAKNAIIAKRQVVIVEGYTDVMACHIAGVDTAVATCGTAFSYDHAKIVRRLISDDSLGAIQLVGPVNGSKVVFTFDGDAAGQKAAMHAFRLDGAFLTQTFVAVAPDNLDPCDLRIQRGDEAVRRLVDDPQPLYDFVINTAIDRCDTQYTAGVVGAMKAVAPVIAQIKDRSLVEAYTRKTAGRLGVPVPAMSQEVASARAALHVQDEDAYAPRKGWAAVAPGHEYEEAQRQAEQLARQELERRALIGADGRRQRYFRIDDQTFLREQQFLGVVIQTPASIDATLFSQLSANSFETPIFRQLFLAVTVAGGLSTAVQMTPKQWAQRLMESSGPGLTPVVSELAVMPLPMLISPPRSSTPAAGDMSEPTKETRAYATSLMLSLIDASFLRQIAAVRQQMSMTADPQAQSQLLSVLVDLQKQRKEMQARAANQ